MGVGRPDGLACQQAQTSHRRNGKCRHNFSRRKIQASQTDGRAENCPRQRPDQQAGRDQGCGGAHGHQHEQVIEAEQGVGQATEGPTSGGAMGKDGTCAQQHDCTCCGGDQGGGEAFHGLSRSAPRTMVSR